MKSLTLILAVIYVLQDEAESFLFSNEQYHSPTLERTIPGTPGKDYPFYSTAPLTEFTCDDKEIGGYYADSESGCQSFHICGRGPEGTMDRYTFLCPNGTIFNERFFICDWWFNVFCPEATRVLSNSFPL